MPRLDNARDTAAWAEGGKESVAVATLPPTRTTGAASAKTLAGNLGNAKVRLAFARTTGRERTVAANVVTVATRAESSSAVAGSWALLISLATQSNPGGTSSISTAPVINNSVVVASRWSEVMSSRSSKVSKALHPSCCRHVVDALTTQAAQRPVLEDPHRSGPLAQYLCDVLHRKAGDDPEHQDLSLPGTQRGD